MESGNEQKRQLALLSMLGQQFLTPLSKEPPNVSAAKQIPLTHLNRNEIQQSIGRRSKGLLVSFPNYDKIQVQGIAIQTSKMHCLCLWESYIVNWIIKLYFLSRGIGIRRVFTDSYRIFFILVTFAKGHSHSSIFGNTSCPG